MKNTTRLLRSFGLLAALALGATACERAFFAEPADPGGTATLALSLAAEGAAGGPSQAFDKADAVNIRVSSSAAVRLDTTLSIQATGGDVPLAVSIPLTDSEENLTVAAEVRRGASALFRGSTQIAVRVGPVPEVALTLTPVSSGLDLPASLPTLTAYGDTIRVLGALVFATGDTVASTPVTWVSLDPTIVQVTGGFPVARADGDARLVGTAGGFSDTTTVRVQAVVAAITLTPADQTIGLGTTRQFTARAFDRRNNPLTGRTITFASSNQSAVSIDANGLATALTLGSAIITASSGGVSATVSLVVRALAPTIVTNAATAVGVDSAVINATVNPNGLPTEMWFMYGTDSTLANLTASPTIQLAASQQDVPIALPLSGLTPARRYFVRAHARNQGGTVTGAVVTFTTLTPPLQVRTDTATNVGPFSAVLNGSVTSGLEEAFAWFEWSYDSTFAEPARTPIITVPAGPNAVPMVAVLDSLFDGGRIYFRAAARSLSDVYVYGVVRTFLLRCGECTDNTGTTPVRKENSPASEPIPERSRAPAQRQE